MIDPLEGDWYDGDAVGKAADAIEEYIHNLGYAVPLEEPGGNEAREIVGLARGAGSHPDILSRPGGMLTR